MACHKGFLNAWFCKIDNRGLEQGSQEWQYEIGMITSSYIGVFLLFVLPFDHCIWFQLYVSEP